MTTRISNLRNGLQLRAARVLAGLSQEALAKAVGVDPRSVRRWESSITQKPTGCPNDLRIEETLRLNGVALTSTPAIGVQQIIR
jgi:transcriptional regulator with XRE-family HTH domain